MIVFDVAVAIHLKRRVLPDFNLHDPLTVNATLHATILVFLLHRVHIVTS